MARIITKELAEAILKKLKARRIGGKKGSAHDEYVIEVEGVEVAYTSLRRGSEKDQGHDHVPRDLMVGPSFAKRMGQCSVSRVGYIQHLRDIGAI